MARSEFEEEIRGAEWRWARLEDIAAMVMVSVYAAQGGGKKADGEYLTPADLLGRERVRLFPSPTLTEAQIEEQEWEEQQAEAKRYKANLLIYETQVRLAQRQGQAAPEITE